MCLKDYIGCTDPNCACGNYATLSPAQLASAGLLHTPPATPPADATTARRPFLSKRDLDALALVFDEWQRRYTENPEAFDGLVDAAGRAVTGYGARCALYFESLVDELQASGLLPAE